jgi:hypothetical protein
MIQINGISRHLQDHGHGKPVLQPSKATPGKRDLIFARLAYPEGREVCVIACSRM